MQDRSSAQSGLWRNIRNALLVGAALVLLSVGAAAASNSGSSVTSNVTAMTVPGSPLAGDIVDPMEAPEVVDMANQLGISRTEALQRFDHQGVLVDYVTTVQDDGGFVDFRGPFAEDGALLIVEPGSESRDPFTNAPNGLPVQAASVSAEKRVEAQQQAETAGRSAAGSAYLGVAYDAFENSYTVWVDSTVDAQAKDAIIEAVRSAITSNPKADVTLRTEEAIVDARVG